MNLLSKSIPKVLTPASHRKRSFSLHSRHPAPFGTGGVGGGAGTAQRRGSWPNVQNPTPYEVLGLERQAPYTKHQFTELAKRYHPDSASHNSGNEDAASRLARFHMVMDAHQILSNPRRREAYDMFGLGWKHQAAPKTHDFQGTGVYARAHEQSSGTDWWTEHEEKSKNKEQAFLKSVTGAVALLVFIALGAWLQLMRAAKMLRAAARGYLQTHESLVIELAKLRTKRGNLTKDDRIKRFLLHREAQAVAKKKTIVK